MILTPDQINELLKIIDKNQLVLTASELGPEFLTDQDKTLLQDSGIDISTLYSPKNDTLFSAFNLGMLAESLYKMELASLSYDQLKQYISHGDYIPLTVRELATIQSIKNQTFTDLKKFGNKIFQDVNGVLTDRSLKGQRDFIKEEMVAGTIDKKTVTEIAHTIAEKTGDWSRDFERIVAYNSHLAFEEGKAAMIKRNAQEEDPIVYKTVFEGACDNCVRLYLTNGLGSEPKLFKLSELQGNGTNIGLKVAEWKPVIGAVHPFCRCLLNHLTKNESWDEEKKKFVFKKTTEELPKRKPIRVTIAGRETAV